MSSTTATTSDDGFRCDGSTEEEERDEKSPPSFSLANRSTTSMIYTTTVKYPQWHNAIAGGVAGAFSRLFTAPLDVIRIRAQLERKDVYPRPSLLTRMINIYKGEGGVTALFRGNLAASYLWIGYTTVQFYAYGTIKQTLEDYREKREKEKEEELLSSLLSKQQQQYSLGNSDSHQQKLLLNILNNQTFIAFVAGAGAGVCATISTYPFDITRTVFAAKGVVATQPRQQQGVTSAPAAHNAPSASSFRPPSSIAECSKTMYRQHGIRGFYAGAAPAIVQIIPYMGLNFSFYTFLTAQKEGENKSIGLSGYAGSISGALSKIIVYPLDTVKKRIQIQSVCGGATAATSSMNTVGGGGGLFYSGLWDCLTTTIRLEGIRGLYRGLFPSVLKTSLGSGLSFAFFRTTKNVLETIHNY